MENAGQTFFYPAQCNILMWSDQNWCKLIIKKKVIWCAYILLALNVSQISPTYMIGICRGRAKRYYIYCVYVYIYRFCFEWQAFPLKKASLKEGELALLRKIRFVSKRRDKYINVWIPILFFHWNILMARGPCKSLKKFHFSRELWQWAKFMLY